MGYTCPSDCGTLSTPAPHLEYMSGGFVPNAAFCVQKNILVVGGKDARVYEEGLSLSEIQHNLCPNPDCQELIPLRIWRSYNPQRIQYAPLYCHNRQMESLSLVEPKPTKLVEFWEWTF